jgi:hypothetical protein
VVQSFTGIKERACYFSDANQTKKRAVVIKRLFLGIT